MGREDKITDRLVGMRGGHRWTDFTVSEHGELPGPPMLPSGCDTSADVWITDGSRLMTGPVAGGAEQFEAKLGSFVRENRLYGAAAGIVHGGELAWSGGVG